MAGYGLSLVVAGKWSEGKNKRATPESQNSGKEGKGREGKQQYKGCNNNGRRL